jgi:hypothetical protein
MHLMSYGHDPPTRETNFVTPCTEIMRMYVILPLVSLVITINENETKYPLRLFFLRKGIYIFGIFFTLILFFLVII